MQAKPKKTVPQFKPFWSDEFIKKQWDSMKAIGPNFAKGIKKGFRGGRMV